MSVLLTSVARPLTLARARSATLILAGLTLGMGSIYAWVVKPGLPYDEPSHWSTVLFYVHHGRMPVLGRPGVTYEAQMGPVAYVVDAVIVRVSEAAGASQNTAFHLVRFAGVAELALAVAVLCALTRRLAGHSWAWVAAVAVLALNPMLLTMSSSVQNDTLALALGLLALELALGRLGDRPTIRSSLLVGAIAGLAVVTKLSAWAAVAAIAAWLVWRHRRAALRPLVAFLVAAVAVSGWWFVRNVELYGDPTAASAVDRTGVSFAPYHVQGASGVAHIFEELVTYLWLPTEYVRNLIAAPTVLKGALLIVSVAVLVAGIDRARRWQSPARGLLLAVAVLSVGAWVVTDLAYQSVAPRVAYLAIPVWAGLVALTLVRLPTRLAIAVTMLTLVSLNAWTLYELARVRTPSFLAP
jgi:4-amino-4-deoxy-L-arabinose transferase-like glycosyltransferase